MGVLGFNSCWLLVFLILTDQRCISSSPVLLLSAFKKSESVALPAEKDIQMRKGLSIKEENEIATTNPPSELNNLVDLSQVKTNDIDFRAGRMQKKNDLPPGASFGKQAFMQLRDSSQIATTNPPSEMNNLVDVPQGKTSDIDFRAGRMQKKNDFPPGASFGKQAFMQLRDSRQTANQDLLLKTKPNRNPIQLPLKLDDRELGIQDEHNNPPNPQVQSTVNQHRLNSVLSPHVVVLDDLPLHKGMSLINLGHIDLKPDVCKAYQFKETIRHRGCNSVSIDNNMCYGQCNSFYIPKRFVSRSYCAPSRMETYEVRLECPGQTPDHVVKKVSVVKECACKDCGLEDPSKGE
ncbi:uncharacterized protein [Montipora foliosa]|uniref:uncharacterized protein n=1 Tax=Montipora foliosa TaxID=591990 RepID=UPI0035F10E21